MSEEIEEVFEPTEIAIDPPVLGIDSVLLTADPAERGYYVFNTEKQNAMTALPQGEASVENASTDIRAALEAGAQPSPPAVPFFVKAWRLRAVSKEQNLYDAAMTAMEALPEPHRTRAIEAFNDADIERGNPLVAMVYQGIGLTSEQVDQLFRDADAIA